MTWIGQTVQSHVFVEANKEGVGMKVKRSEFVISAVSPKQYPQDDLPQIALVGRSNVGKSSFVNKLINRKRLARTSSRPGKTQTLNFYKIYGERFDFHFADLPGYGYAKVSKQVQSQWGPMIQQYLLEGEDLLFVIQITDIRHPPSKEDRAMYAWLKDNGVPVVVIATKLDKIPKGKVQKHLKIIREALELEGADELVAFSAETGQGKDEVWKEIKKRLAMDAEM